MYNIDYTTSLRRIADALERIAKALEESNEKSGFLGKEAAGTTTTAGLYPYEPPF